MYCKRVPFIIKQVFTRVICVCLWLALGVFMCPAPAKTAQGPEKLSMRAQLVLNKAGRLMTKKEYGRAILTLTEFQARGGSMTASKGVQHPKIFFVLGNCYLLQENYKSAATAYQRALARDPAYISAWLNLARASYEQKEYGRAGQCFTTAYETAEEKQAEYLYYSATAFLMAKQHTRSIAVFEQLFQAHPAEIKPEWKEYLVHALLAAKQPRRALPLIEELARDYSSSKQIRWQEILLYQYLQLDMQPKALAYALELTRENPAFAKWWKALVHVRLNSGNYKDGLVAMIVYGWLTPLTDQERRLLADLHLQLGIPAKAAPLYETALHHKPNKRLLKNLVLAYQQLDRPEEALKKLEIYKENKNNPELLLLKGDLLYGLKKFDAAANAYRQAAGGKNKQAGRAWLMAGYAAWQAADLQGSHKAFKQASLFSRHKKAALEAMHYIQKEQKL